MNLRYVLDITLEPDEPEAENDPVFRNLMEKVILDLLMAAVPRVLPEQAKVTMTVFQPAQERKA